MQEFHGKIQAMQYTNKYSSPLGEMLMAADDTGLTGLWFMGQKYFALYLDREHKEKDLPVFRDTKHWLDIYFSGKEPNFKLPLHFTGSPFQNEVWKILYSIPYGKTMTYGEIARIIALQARTNVGSGDRQRRRTQRNINYCSLSQSCRQFRKFDGLCRRNRQKGKTAQT